MCIWILYSEVYVMSLGLLGSYGGSGSDSEISDYSGEGKEKNKTENVGCNETSLNVKQIIDTDIDSLTDQSANTLIQSHTTTAKLVPDSAKRCEDPTDEERRQSPVSQGRQGCESPPAVSYGLTSDGIDIIDSDTSDSHVTDDDEESGSGEDIRGRSPLPIPVLDGSDQLACSVFSNPYRKAEEAKLAVLKQHVDLSHHPEPSEKQRRHRGGKRGWGKHRGRSHSQFGTGESSHWNDGDSPMRQERQRKHRSGVGESLQPPKKYMKKHQQIQSEERPWTTR